MNEGATRVPYSRRATRAAIRSAVGFEARAQGGRLRVVGLVAQGLSQFFECGIGVVELQADDGQVVMDVGRVDPRRRGRRADADAEGAQCLLVALAAVRALPPGVVGPQPRPVERPRLP